MGLSLAGFIWLAWFLLATPASSFDTQGPGLLGAFVMFASQWLGVVGLVLLVVWRTLSIWLDRRTRAGKIKTLETN